MLDKSRRNLSSNLDPENIFKTRLPYEKDINLRQICFSETP